MMLLSEYHLLNLQSLWMILKHMLEQTQIRGRMWLDEIAKLKIACANVDQLWSADHQFPNFQSVGIISVKETGFASSENLFLNNIGAICPAVCPNFSTQSFVNSRIKVNVGTTPNEIGRCFIADMLQQRTPHHEYLFPAKRFTSSGGSRKFWWGGGILSTKPQKFGCLHQYWEWFFGRNRKFKRFFRPKSGGLSSPNWEWLFGRIRYV